MGVPVLTLKGNTGVSRQTASILNEIGLHEWISSSEEEFINLAIQHTKNLNSLNKLRFNLREKMKNSTLLNGLQFARYFKETLENIFSK
jgi:predicted O-linked N-acetylglucosamine transferase (SPINDLY family)